MPKYRAILLYPAGSGEGRFEFEGPVEFLTNAPARVMDTFLATVDDLDLPAIVSDTHINAAQLSADYKTVTALGQFILEEGAPLPFTAMISQAE